jgi:hypothetical protein
MHQDMDMSNIMTVSAQQAKDIDHYKIKEKPCKTSNILNNSTFVGFIVLMVY